MATNKIAVNLNVALSLANNEIGRKTASGRKTAFLHYYNFKNNILKKTDMNYIREQLEFENTYIQYRNCCTFEIPRQKPLQSRQFCK